MAGNRKDADEAFAFLKKLPSLLLAWYDKNARVLPWRDMPLPYHVWVSEIMLQQTRVEAVLPYFSRFLKAFPTIESLAGAEESVLLKAWEGLGYYSRVRNLKKAAKMVKEKYNGEFPSLYEDILCLPGIGEYTAGAIASIAFGIRVPAVDGNVLRVFARVLASSENVSQTGVKKRFRDEILKIMPFERAGDFNQAFMELGATVCLPNGMPKCGVCPLFQICLAKEKNLQNSLPVKNVKKQRSIERRTVFLFVFEDKVALRLREDEGLLAKMWEFPNGQDLSPEQAMDKWDLPFLSIEDAGEAKHIFTHVEWHMNGYLAVLTGKVLPAGWVWADRDELARIYALPSAFKAYLNRLLDYLDKR